MQASITAESWRAARAILLFAMVAFAPATVHAQNLDLAWDASPDVHVVGYTVHVGINPGVFGQTFDVPGSSSTTFTFTQAVPGQRYYFAVSAYDAANVSSALSNVISWKINVGPTLSQPTNQTGAVGTVISLQLTATDDGDPLTFTASGLPPGLSIAASTGVISGTPTTGGTYTVSATVSDGVLSAATTFTWTINARLTVTSLTSSVPSPGVAGTSIVFTAAATAGVSPYQYKFLQTFGSTTTVVRNWASSASYTWTPAQAGSYVVTVWARSAGVAADVAEGSMTMSFVVNPPPMSVTGLASSLPSPRVANTSITFTAAATGGAAPYQYKYVLTSGGTTTTVRSWSTSALYTWTPTQPNTYVITVWVRSAGQTADVAEATRSVNYTVLAPLALGITSSLPSPQPVRTSITFTAATSGGVPPFQYKWWIFDGSTWAIVQNWSGSATYTWTPTSPNPFYRVSVWVREATSTIDYGVNLSVPFPIGAAAAPVAPAAPTITSFTSSVASPRITGTAITFTAAASGGVAPYQFKFLVNSGSGWTTARDWNGANSYTWVPLTAGAYQMTVWVRNATSTVNAADASAVVPYTITSTPSGGPITITSLSANLVSPQPAGTSITFTAGASGGAAPYQYKWWVFNGSTWSIAQNWSGNASYTWTPMAPNSDYRIAVWVRGATSAIDYGVNLSVPFPIGEVPTPPTITSFTSSLASPRVTGTAITFTAGVLGGVAPYQFKFLVNSGSGWTIARDWTGAASHTWVPLTAGVYEVAVWVRNATSTANAADASATLPYKITSPTSGAQIAITSLTANLPSPQPVDASITFTAAASGGRAPLQYKWWVLYGSTWVVVQNWSSSATYNWSPQSPSSAYRVAVWVRESTSTIDYGVNLSVPFPIVP